MNLTKAHSDTNSAEEQDLFIKKFTSIIKHSLPDGLKSEKLEEIFFFARLYFLTPFLDLGSTAW